MIKADHASLMDSVYGSQRYIYDFTRKYYLLGRDRLIADLPLKAGDRLVEVGCGTARNLIKLAKLHPDAHFFGLDASAEMLKSANKAVHRAGLSSRISVAQGLAEDLTPTAFTQSRPFDWVLFSYSLSMITDWKQALNKAAGIVGPEGKIAVADFGDFQGLGSAGAWLMKRWLSSFHVLPREEMLARLGGGGGNSPFESNDLTILPGRYAFLWQGTSTAVRQLVQ